MAKLNEFFIVHATMWQFSNDLYDIYHSSVAPDQNILVSPFAIQWALTFCMTRAGGTTATEIARGLRIGKDDIGSFTSLYGNRVCFMDRQLSLANSLFFMNGCQGQKNYEWNDFETKTQQIDFTNAPKAARIINTWIKNHTRRRIKNSVSPNDLNASTTMVMANTVQLNCLWWNKFAKCNTKKQPFFHSATESCPVDMMWQENDFAFSTLPTLDANGIRLLYADSALSMVILLPRSRTGLELMNSVLKKSSITEIFQQIKSARKVSVSLPKFSVEFELKIDDVLKRMGVTSMYDDKLADFRMRPNAPRTYVSTFVHKAYFEVVEKGTTVGAGTKMKYKYNPMIPYFNANHPFRFFVCNDEDFILLDGCFRNASNEKKRGWCAC